MSAGQFPPKFDGGHGGPVERWCPFNSFVPPCGVCSSERIFNAVISLFACVWKVLNSFSVLS